MRKSTGKLAVSGIIAAGLFGVYRGTSYAGSLEDQQPAASAIVAKANQLPEGKNLKSKVEAKGLEHGLIRMSDILKGASPAAKEEFLDSLVLLDGKVASVSLEKLTRELGETKVKAMLWEIFPV